MDLVANHPNEQLVLDFYDAFGKADQAWFTKHTTEDFVWKHPGRSPLAGTYHGFDEVFNGLRATVLRLSNGQQGFELLNVFGNDRGAVSIHRDYYTGTDDRLDLTYVVVFTLRGDRLAQVQEIPYDQYDCDRFWNQRQQTADSVPHV